VSGTGQALIFIAHAQMRGDRTEAFLFEKPAWPGIYRHPAGCMTALSIRRHMQKQRLAHTACHQCLRRGGRLRLDQGCRSAARLGRRAGFRVRDNQRGASIRASCRQNNPLGRHAKLALCLKNAQDARHRRTPKICALQHRPAGFAGTNSSRRLEMNALRAIAT